METIVCVCVYVCVVYSYSSVYVRLVTGDNINTAKAIARECGILTDEGIAIEGPDFREKSLEELHELIPKIQVLFGFLFAMLRYGFL